MSADTEICEVCIRRVADLASASSESIWSDGGSDHPPTPVQPVVTDATEPAFEEFKRGVARQLTPEDVEAHSDLARAYWEMGLYRDARREAGIAIGSRVDTRATAAALQLLLTPPLLRVDGRRHLRERLRRPLH